ncbi:MAG: acetate kinase [Candidatus Pacebacteria bacterium]|nr:acetate kinase [Candidatus Paceibacterota bacterium]
MILILNCGSQSIKWKLFDKGLKLKRQKKREVFNSKDYRKVLIAELEGLKEASKIEKIGHRVVHGGERFRKKTRIDSRVLKEIRKLNSLAPLHNPFNLLGIETAKRIFPKVPQIAVFDTEIYSDLPDYASTYPLPENIAGKYRRFGFHGISHYYAMRKGAQMINRPYNKLKIITCHLGGGASITAFRNGKAIDTSMGFTPMEGLMMMTRCGDIDPGITIELAKRFSVKRCDRILNFESGFKGLTGIDSMIKVLKKRKDKKVRLALDIFIYRIKKYISAYFGILKGCDLLVFTGTIGFKSKIIRNMILKDLDILKNTKIKAIETDEELAIAEKILI